MTDWNSTALEKIAAAEELDLASERSNGTLRDPVTMWVVRSGDGLYVRSVKGTGGPWYRGTQSRHQGRIEAGGVRQDVTFQQATPDEYPEVDAAYREKYGHYTSIVEHVLTDGARASTLRLEPRDRPGRHSHRRPLRLT
ncbi:DUF2255 family protein [Streptomyces sp. NPDC048269]|uniref:DUF2255 family protein n=1 Tax=Streptomyces sp. NPDC048269 TaxID=3155753 RepID=UPI00343D88B2